MTSDLDLDSVTIDVSCPSCREKARARIGRLRRDPTLVCVVCGVSIPIDGQALRNDVMAVERAFDALRRRVRACGRR